jgi:hypothetical protein
MDTNIDSGKNDAFLGLVLLMRIFWGPMFWPIIIGNALAYLWCVYQVSERTTWRAWLGPIRTRPQST